MEVISYLVVYNKFLNDSFVFIKAGFWDQQFGNMYLRLLKFIRSMKIQCFTPLILPPFHITVGIHRQVTILALYHRYCRLVSLRTRACVCIYSFYCLFPSH